MSLFLVVSSEDASLEESTMALIALSELAVAELGTLHTSSSGSSAKSNSWGSLEADGADLGKLSETEAAAFATAAENLSRVTPRVKKTSRTAMLLS